MHGNESIDPVIIITDNAQILERTLVRLQRVRENKSRKSSKRITSNDMPFLSAPTIL